MRKWLALLCLLLLTAGCSPKVSGMGARISHDEAMRMAREGSPLVEVTDARIYTSPPTVHVIYGKDKEDRPLVVFVYTTVIRYVYADQLISTDRAREIAASAGFPAGDVIESSLQVFQGILDGRDRPVFWRLSTGSTWIWIDAETGQVLKRLDAFAKEN